MLPKPGIRKRGGIQCATIYYPPERRGERNANNLPGVTCTRGRGLSGTLAAAGGIGGLLASTALSTLTSQPSTAHAYYYADGNGNITCMINSQQAAVARYLYEPFGPLLRQEAIRRGLGQAKKEQPEYKARRSRWVRRLLGNGVKNLIKGTRQECAGRPQARAVEDELEYFFHIDGIR
jgi:hypothetical protein